MRIFSLIQGMEFCQKLRSLRLACLAVSDAILPQISALTGLENLDLSYCRKLTQGALLKWIPRLQRLKKLSLHRINLSPTAIASLTRSLPLVRKIGRAFGEDVIEDEFDEDAEIIAVSDGDWEAGFGSEADWEAGSEAGFGSGSEGGEVYGDDLYDGEPLIAHLKANGDFEDRFDY